MRNNKLFKRVITAAASVALVMGNAAPITSALAEEEATLTRTGWAWEDGVWYYYENGAHLTSSWLVDPNYANSTFYLGADGVMATDWQFVDNDWFFFGTSGRMKTGWIWSESYQGWYYLNEGTNSFKPLGAMLRNTTASDGSYVDGNGRWTTTKPTTVDLMASYDYHLLGYDYSVTVDSITLHLDSVPDNVTPNPADFTVSETQQVFDWGAFAFTEDTTAREVIGAQYVSADGVPADGPTPNVQLTLAYRPGVGEPLVYSGHDMMNHWADPFFFTVALSADSDLTVGGAKVATLSVNKDAAKVTDDLEDWNYDSFTASDGVEYPCATWDPEEESDSLVVWLHGLGEGGTEGTDIRVPLLGAKVTALASDEFQKTVGNAHILVPQCPTYWMDNDGQRGNFVNGGIQADGTSYYTKSLEELIDSYKEKIGAKKVIIAGCSNGGYMTMMLAMSRPDAYDAVVPICEAVPDQFITDEQIASLKDLPMYFIYADNDPLVPPADHEIPTIERLRAAGKSDDTLFVSTTPNVVDLTGKVKDAEGNPYEYSGHYSWVYFFNNSSIDDQHGFSSWDFIGRELDRENWVTATTTNYIVGDDWGCGVHYLMLNLDKPIDSASASDFKVTESKEAIDWSDPSYPSIIATAERTVTRVFYADESMKASDTPTNHLVLALAISPTEGSPFVWSPKTFYNTMCDPYELKVELTADAQLTSEGKAVKGIMVSEKAGRTITNTGKFKRSSHETESGITYQYASHTPEQDSDVLVVWLHGMGESQGVDVNANNSPLIPLLGNKVTAFATSAFQEKIGPAHILVPQCPTYWMDKDGTAANKLTRLDSDGTSYYTKSLEELIDWYAAEVGAKKIVLTGASNGGYMVLNLALSRPDAYTAVVPISETIQDKYLTDEDIAKLVNVPLFFVYCNADTTAVAANCSIPTIERLQAAGATAETLKWSSSDKVIDTSGRFFKDDGSPYEYSGHWAWVYYDNDESIDDTDGVTSAWDFISQQVNRTNE